MIADLSKFYHLQRGDLIFTGTPEAVERCGPANSSKEKWKESAKFG